MKPQNLLSSLQLKIEWTLERVFAMKSESLYLQEHIGFLLIVILHLGRWPAYNVRVGFRLMS